MLGDVVFIVLVIWLLVGSGIFIALTNRDGFKDEFVGYTNSWKIVFVLYCFFIAPFLIFVVLPVTLFIDWIKK